MIAIQIGSRCYSISSTKDLFNMIVNHKPADGVLEVKDLPKEYCEGGESQPPVISSNSASQFPLATRLKARIPISINSVNHAPIVIIRGSTSSIPYGRKRSALGFKKEVSL